MVSGHGGGWGRGSCRNGMFHTSASLDMYIYIYIHTIHIIHVYIYINMSVFFTFTPPLGRFSSSLVEPTSPTLRGSGLRRRQVSLLGKHLVM